MKKSHSLINSSVNNFLYNLKTSICFEMLYKILVWFIFVPINYSILKIFFKKVGVDTVTSKQIVKFALSYNGIFYMAIMMIIAFVVVFMEIGVLIYIAKRSHDRKQASIFEGVFNSIKSLGKLFSPYVLGLIFIVAVIGPLTGVGLFTPLVKSLSIQDYLKYQLLKRVGGEPTLCAFNIIFVIVFSRWLLVLPSMIIEKGNLDLTFNHGVSIYKKNRIKIFMSIFGWIVINYGVKIFLLGGLVGSGLFFIILTEGLMTIQEVITNSSLIVFFLIYVIVSIISLPIFTSFLVELYYKYRFYSVSENNFAIQDYFERTKYYSLLRKNKDGFIIVILVIFTIVTGSRGFSIVFNRVVQKDVQITAHRGSSLKAPENSISSITEAIIEGADYAEIDVMTTLEDEVVLFHDNSLRRFTGSSKQIKKLTLDEVQKIDIGSKFSSDFQGETIPTLDEVLRLSKDNIKLNIELKPRKKDDKLAEIVANMITEKGLEEQVIISSQNYESLQRVKEINPLIDVGLIVTFGIGDFSKMNVDFISVEYRMAKKELIYAMHALGKEVHVWTINDKVKMEDVIKLGVDNVITDNPLMGQRTYMSIHENDDIDFLTRFLDGVTALMKYVKI